tara:strand:+ start:9289 stop:11163 length:1875 start_codon:yes stop_codon:yes gene_type:complete
MFVLGCNQIEDKVVDMTNTRPLYSPSLLNFSCDDTFSISNLPEGLFITEVGEPRYGYQDWFEIYNASKQAIDLQDYQIRTQQRARDGSWLGTTATFDLPHQVIQPDHYMVIESAYDKTYYLQPMHWSDDLVSNQRMKIKDPITQNSIGFAAERGSIELLHQGTVVDAVFYGAQDILDTKDWQGVATLSLSVPQKYGSLIRVPPYEDHNNASDWYVSAFITKGGRNDIHPGDMSCTDTDQDGIPDCAEQMCRTYAGLPYYAWGARPGVQDIFLQASWMQESSGLLEPRYAALEMIRNTFAQYQPTSSTRAMRLHIDTGQLFSAVDAIDTDNFNLFSADSLIRVGDPVPFSQYTNLQPQDEENMVNALHYQEQYMDVRRESVFNYVLYAHQINPSNPHVTGIAYVGYYRTLIIALGGHLEHASFSQEDHRLNYIVNMQASTTLHELGHIFNLWHGGQDNENGKPNYISSMNYLYMYGLPALMQAPDDRYRYHRCRESIPISQMSQSVLGEPHNFVIDYSYGRAGLLDEQNLDEDLGLAGDYMYPFDFNCDGDSNDTSLAFDLNPRDMYQSSLSQVSDFNDWQEIQKHIDFHKKLNSTDQEHITLEFSPPYLPYLKKPVCDVSILFK